MAVSRLDSHGANIRAINAAKSAGRNARVDSILIRLSTISQPDELAGAMLDRIISAEAVLGQRVPLAVATYCTENKRAIPGSLSEACREIGYDAVRKIVQIVGISTVHEELAIRCGLSKTHLTNQAVAVAVGSEFLAKKAGLSGPLGFSCGLFANIGVSVLAYSEKGYQGIESMVAGGTVQLRDAEARSLDCSHDEAGYCLLTDYNFPELIAQVAAAHCSSIAAPMVRATALSESLAHQLGFDGGFAIVPLPFDEQGFAALGGTDADAAQLVESMTRWNALIAKILE